MCCKKYMTHTYIFKDLSHYLMNCRNDIDEVYIEKMLAKQKQFDNCVLASKQLTVSFIEAILAGDDIINGNFYGRN